MNSKYVLCLLTLNIRQIDRQIEIDNIERWTEIDNTKIDNIEIDNIEIDIIQIDNIEIDNIEIDNIEIYNTEIDNKGQITQTQRQIYRNRPII